MKLTAFISSPRGFHKLPRYRRTLKLWDRAKLRSTKYDSIRIVRTEPTPLESHQELLSRTWTTRILPNLRSSHYLFTECDFLPRPDIFDRIFDVLAAHPFAAPTSCHHTWPAGKGIYSSHPIFVDHFAAPGVRSVGPWLMFFDFTKAPATPPADWLTNDGDPPDTANAALAHCLKAGVFPSGADYTVAVDSSWAPDRPNFSMAYPGFGLHCFQTRDCKRPDDFLLCGVLKVKDHFDSYDRFLAEAERQYDAWDASPGTAVSASNDLWHAVSEPRGSRCAASLSTTASPTA